MRIPPPAPLSTFPAHFLGEPQNLAAATRPLASSCARATTCLFTVLLLASGTAYAENEADESDGAEAVEGLEIGGIVTVDAYLPTDAIDKTSIEASMVELSANVTLHPDLVAHVALLSMGDLNQISIDRAVASWTPAGSGMQLQFGQQYYPHGLQNTRLPSDPISFDDVQFPAPGVLMDFEAGPTTLGAGVLQMSAEEPERTFPLVDENGDTAAIALPDPDDDNPPLVTAIAHADLEIAELALLRGSSIINHDLLQADLAFALEAERFTLDLEGFIDVPSLSRTQRLGAIAGTSFDLLPERLTLATRVDYLSRDKGASWEWRAVGGVVVQLMHGIFVAGEFARSEAPNEQAFNQVELQIGLESNLQLPGWQRQTLTSGSE